MGVTAECSGVGYRESKSGGQAVVVGEYFRLAIAGQTGGKAGRVVRIAQKRGVLSRASSASLAMLSSMGLTPMISRRSWRSSRKPGWMD